jgi:hypothetical protein
MRRRSELKFEANRRWIPLLPRQPGLSPRGVGIATCEAAHIFREQREKNF